MYLTLGKRKAEEKFRLSGSVLLNSQLLFSFPLNISSPGGKESYERAGILHQRETRVLWVQIIREGSANTAMGNRATGPRGRSTAKFVHLEVSCHAEVTENS